MKTINLTVDEKNIDTVMTILNSLKDNLILNIQTDSAQTTKTTRQTKYQPKTNTIVREENSGTNDTNGKYLNPNAYRAKLKNKK